MENSFSAPPRVGNNLGFSINRGGDNPPGNGQNMSNGNDIFGILGAACGLGGPQQVFGAQAPAGCPTPVQQMEPRGYTETYSVTVPAGASASIELKPAKKFAVSDMVITASPDSSTPPVTDTVGLFVEQAVVGSQTQSPQGQGANRTPVAVFDPIANRPCIRWATAMSDKPLTMRLHNTTGTDRVVHVTLVGAAFDGGVGTY